MELIVISFIVITPLGQYSSVNGAALLSSGTKLHYFYFIVILQGVISFQSLYGFLIVLRKVTL